MKRGLAVFIFCMSFIHAQSRYDEAIKLYYKNEYELAIGKLNSYLKDYPKHADSYNLLGSIYMDMGDTLESIRQYHKAISCNPNEYLYYSNLAWAFKEKGQHDSAVYYYDFAIQHNDQDYELFFRRGYCKIQLKDWKGTVEDNSKSIKLNPQNYT